MQGICTSPQTGSHVSPKWCSRPISAAYSICEGVPPKSWQAAAAASHGAGDAHFALAADFGAGDRRVGFGDVAEQSARGQGTQDAQTRKVARVHQMIEYCRHDGARSAGRSRDDGAARSVFLGCGEGVGIQLGAGAQRVGVALGLDQVGAGLAGNFESTRKDSFGSQTPHDGFAHGGPDLIEIIPNSGAFALFDILPEGLPLAVAPLQNLGNMGHGIDVGRRILGGFLVGQSAPADAVNHPFVHGFFRFEGFETHAVGVERQGDVGTPDDFGRSHGLQHGEDRYVGHVPFAGSCQRSVQRYLVPVGIGSPFDECFGCLLGTHRMTARGSGTDFIEFLE